MPPSSADTTAPAAQQSARHDALLDAAARQLNARGVSQRTLTDVAASLGFTRNALYHYVQDFEDLLGQVYRRSCIQLGERLSESMSTGPPPEILRAFVGNALDGRRPEIAALNEYGLLRPHERAEVAALYSAIETRLAGIIADGSESGAFRPCDPEIVAKTILNIVHWTPLGTRRGLRVGVAERADAADMLNSVLTSGWAADRYAPIDPPVIDLSPLILKVTDGFDQAALHEVKRESILSCASQMFNSRGVDTTSLDELARVLGTTKARLYKYVGDKATLVEECFARADRINRFVRQAARNLPCSPMDRLVALLRTSTAIRLGGPLEPMRYAFTDDVRERIAPDLVRRRMKRMVAANAELFAEGQTAGIVRSFNVERLQLLNLTAGGGLTRPDPDHGPIIAKTAAEMVDVARIGLSPL